MKKLLVSVIFAVFLLGLNFVSNVELAYDAPGPDPMGIVSNL